MPNSFFQFKQFTVHQEHCAMKVTTDGCLFGAWTAEVIHNSTQSNSNCLDIGTGTGLLSLMLTQKNTTIEIDAIEIDKDAAVQATNNVATSPFTETIQIIHADVKDYDFEKKYDIIISNPPFYEKELKGNDGQKNKAHHDDGLLLSDLLQIIKINLNPNGLFFLLQPFKRNEEINDLISQQGLSIVKKTFVSQTTAHDYFRIMIVGNQKTEFNNETITEEMAIKDEHGNYTQGFSSLLIDYYLQL